MNTILPQKCLVCNTICHTEKSAICNKCWKNIDFISQPYCNNCGYPLDEEVAELQTDCKNMQKCSLCIVSEIQPIQLRAVCLYNKASSTIVTKLKYNDQTYYAKFIAQMMMQRYAEYIALVDFITYVPMTKKRLISRMFNQSAIIAKHISKMSNKKILVNVLIKTKETKRQVTLNREQRKLNLLNSFKINKQYKELIQDKNILIVDDVSTTMSTINECSMIIKKNKGHPKAIVFGYAKR